MDLNQSTQSGTIQQKIGIVPQQQVDIELILRNAKTNNSKKEMESRRFEATKNDLDSWKIFEMTSKITTESNTKNTMEEFCEMRTRSTSPGSGLIKVQVPNRSKHLWILMVFLSCLRRYLEPDNQRLAKWLVNVSFLYRFTETLFSIVVSK